MKKNLLIAALAIFGCASAFAQGTEQPTTNTETYYVKNDVSLRWNWKKDGDKWVYDENNQHVIDNADKANPNQQAIEMYTDKEGDEVCADLVGLMSFNIPEKDGYDIIKATLVLYTERAKGSMDIYAFGNSISDEDTYNSQSEYIKKAREATALVSQRLNGASNKAVTDEHDMKNVDDWKNEFDITSYVQETGEGNDVNLLLCNHNDDTPTSIKVYSSDVQDVENVGKDESVTFKADELKPQLIVEYTTATGINEVETVEPVAKGKEGIYTLSGVRVAKADRPGIYIINGKKVLVGRK